MVSRGVRDGEYKHGYRPDIDGLRAFAVLGVVIYHAVPDFLRGGFVGVDVFFVISGFLITGIIVREIHAGSFSFRNFYSRRIRRIFPGLFITLAASLAFGLLFFYPNELSDLSEQSLSAAGFVANIYFWATANYFSESANQTALLHLWTLGLEEQFYIIWPVALVIVAFIRIDAKYLILLAILFSFALNIKYYRWQPEWVFFLPPARFWELLTGSALALLIITKPSPHRKGLLVRELVSIVSVCVLISSFFLIDGARFPGWQVVAPVMSTTMLIWAGPGTATSRYVLSNRAIVWIGLISYPLYLYHWPLLSLSQSHRFEGHFVVAVITGIFLSILFAAITYHYVEKPIRSSKTKRSLSVLIFTALCIALIAAFIRSGHLGGRIQSYEVSQIEAAISDWELHADNYRKLSGFELTDLHKGKSNILVIGDSHASQYYSWFKGNLPAFSKEGYGVQFATYGGCPVLPETNRLEAGYGCPKFYEFAFSHARSDSVDTVVLSSWWESYFGLRYGVTNPQPMLDIDLSDLGVIAEKFGDDLENLVANGKNVIVLLSNPTSPGFDPGTMISRTNGGIQTTGISRVKFLEYVEPISSIFSQHLNRPGIRLVDTTVYFCDNDYCPSLDNTGLPIYKDTHHFRSSYIEENADFLFEILDLPNMKTDTKSNAFE